MCWRPAHEPSYAYLLGLYLGDGWLFAQRRGGVVLRLSLDLQYPQIIDDCLAAMVLSMPQRRPGFVGYFFSNLSAHIRRLFCEACEALDVRWTLSNPRNVSVAHGASVARIDAIGCAKD